MSAPSTPLLDQRDRSRVASRPQGQMGSATQTQMAKLEETLTRVRRAYDLEKSENLRLREDVESWRTRHYHVSFQFQTFT
jgi:hypothetical protein